MCDPKAIKAGDILIANKGTRFEYRIVVIEVIAQGKMRIEREGKECKHLLWSTTACMMDLVKGD
jgi:hypothetical protein